MPRSPSPPPLPDSPARWLANFRYRLINERGERLSPESLGYHLGVSGATVRRWEAGLSSPDQEDLHRFSDICNLTNLQREFLHRLYARNGVNSQVSPAVFRAEVARILTISRPAFLADELFYIRAWNSCFAAYADHLEPDLPRGVNAIRLAFESGMLSDVAEEDERVSKVVRLLWMWTAHLAVYPAYSDLIRSLLENELFARHWRAIIDEAGPEASEPLLLPAIERYRGDERYIVYMGEMLFPPLYRLFVFEPVNDSATRTVGDWASAARSGSQGSAIHFANAIHWAT